MKLLCFLEKRRESIERVRGKHSLTKTGGPVADSAGCSVKPKSSSYWEHMYTSFPAFWVVRLGYVTEFLPMESEQKSSA